MRRFLGGRLASCPAYLQPRPPRQPPPRAPAAGSAKPRSWSAAAGLKAVMLPSAGKAPGRPPAFHPPWNKARVGPVTATGGGGERREGREGGGAGWAVENGENGRGRRDEGTARRADGGATEARRTSHNGARGAAERGGGTGPERRGELPGHFPGLDGGPPGGGSYFQTSSEAQAEKQRLSEALGLISLARRLRGAARVGNEERSDGGENRPGGGESGREMYGSLGDLSVSASLCERVAREPRRTRWESESEDGNSSTEVWRRRGGKCQRCRSGAGSGSRSPSGASSHTSSDRDETETESGEETGQDEGGPGADTEPERGSRAGESGPQGGDGRTDEWSRRRSKGSAGIGGRSARGRETDSEGVRCSGPALSGCRPQTAGRQRSSRAAVEEDGDGEEARGEPAEHLVPSDRGATDASDDLSAIMEDAEGEERSSGRGGKGEEEEEEEQYPEGK